MFFTSNFNEKPSFPFYFMDFSIFPQSAVLFCFSFTVTVTALLGFFCYRGRGCQFVNFLTYNGNE